MTTPKTMDTCQPHAALLAGSMAETEETVEHRPESHNDAHAPRRIDLSKEELRIDGYVGDALMGEKFACAGAPDPSA